MIEERKKNKEGLKDLIRDHFDEQTNSFATSSFQDHCGSSVINHFLDSPYKYLEKKLLENIKGKKVLDYCCGTGVYSIFPATQGAIVSGIDISSQSIKVAKDRSERMNVSDRCFFEVGDAENLSYKSRTFDIALSLGSLTYLNLDRAFSELHRVLKQDGILIIIDSLGHNPIFNINRRSNINNYASGNYEYLKSIKIDKLKKAASPYFDLVDKKYFDFLTVLGFFLFNRFKINLNSQILKNLDKIILYNEFLGKYAFKGIFVFKVRNKKLAK